MGLSLRIQVSDGSRFDAGPFSEIAVLTFKGDVIRPEGCKYRHAEVTIYVREGLLGGHTREPAPSVGGVDARNDWLGAYAWLPVERLDGLLAAAAAKRFKVIALDTTRIFRRRARLRGVRFYTELDEEDL